MQAGTPAPVACQAFWPDLGAAVQQLEQEVKLDPNPGWSLPDLSGVLPGVEVHALPDVALETTYYDTADLRLARHHLTLRFRRQTELVPGPRRVDDRSTTEVWTVKLPLSSDSTVLARTEVTWPGEGAAAATGRRSSRRPRATGRGLQTSGYEFEKVHPEAAHFVQAAAIGRPLEPVAHLSSIRRRTELRTSDGRPLAEIDEDTITGRDLLASQERPFRHGDSPDVRFREVEVELAQGSALEVLAAVVERLEQAGARRSPGKSKLARVLAGGSAEVDLADLSHSAPDTRAHELAMSEVLREQARSCLDTLIDHDPAIRLDDADPEHIHRSRVATRRLRTILREFAPLVTYGPEDQVAYSPDHPAANDPGDVANAAEAWFGTLTGELKWLGGILGSVRDSDVRLQSLEQHCAKLPAADAAAGETLLKAAQRRTPWPSRGAPRRHQYGPLPGRPAGARRPRLRARCSLTCAQRTVGPAFRARGYRHARIGPPAMAVGPQSCPPPGPGALGRGPPPRPDRNQTTALPGRSGRTRCPPLHQPRRRRVHRQGGDGTPGRPGGPPRCRRDRGVAAPNGVSHCWSSRSCQSYCHWAGGGRTHRRRARDPAQVQGGVAERLAPSGPQRLARLGHRRSITAAATLLRKLLDNIGLPLCL